jgi:Ni,Fe-hydrogenase III large subunit
MVEATKNNTIVLLLPKSMQADEQGWAAKFSTADYPVKVTTSKNFAKNCCGLIVYAVTADDEGTEECAKVHKSTYANVPAVVSMADGAAFNTTELIGKIAEARTSIE